jgi:cyclopropane fatty-acyl-phospholipid synthase-like methyltransferase
MMDNPLSMRRTGATLRQLALAPGLKVLDAGCGPGRLAIPIAEAVGDPHYQSLARVKTLAEDVGFRPGAVYGSRLAYSIVLEK